MVFLLFLLLLALVTAIQSGKSEILKITDTTYDKAMKDNAFLFAKFYAPWWGHCKSLVPVWEKAADMLKEHGSKARVADLDCTVEKASAQKNEVISYPTLLFFVNGQFTEKYEGKNTLQDIFYFVLVKTGEIQDSAFLRKNKMNHQYWVDRIFQVAVSPQIHRACKMMAYQSSSITPVEKIMTPYKNLLTPADNDFSNFQNRIRNQEFFVVQREPGTTNSNIPIWALRPSMNVPEASESQKFLDPRNLVDPDIDSASLNTQNEVVDEKRGIFLITNALTSEECDRILSISEALGYTLDAPVSLGRDIRQNDSCTWIADEESLNQIIYERVKDFLPQTVSDSELQGRGGGNTIHTLSGLNARWRFYRYNQHDIFKPHTDGGWGKAAVVGKFQESENENHGCRMHHDVSQGNEASYLTFLMYLNDDVEGGATKFYLPSSPENASRLDADGNELLPIDILSVRPKKGSVICFYHGNHKLSPVHEGEFVETGSKYVIRTDVLYRRGEKTTTNNVHEEL